MKTICKLIGSMVGFYLSIYLLTDATLRIGIAIGERESPSKHFQEIGENANIDSFMKGYEEVKKLER